VPILYTKVEGGERVAHHLSNRVYIRALTLMRRALEYRADRIIAAIREDVDDNFDEPSGLLMTGLWAGDVKRKGSRLWIEVGWGHAHGPVLEFGPNKGSWEIHAKEAKSLRFWEKGHVGNPGYIRYAKKVTHYWDPSQLRPHFGPEIMKQQPALMEDLGIAIRTAVQEG